MTTTADAELNRETVDRFKQRYALLQAEVAKRIVGYREVVDQVLTAMFAGGHVLLEGVPGLGKTLMVRTISEATRLNFRRIQFTPDLMPADITGTNIFYEDERGQRTFQFQHGPIFANLVLADEINRATPKTQSAVLESMQEHTVTVGGKTHALPEPFWVLATQNPIEMEGTYPLPEAQLDRFFFKVNVTLQGEEELVRIADQTTGDDDVSLSPALNREEILEMQRTVRQVMAAGFVQRYAARIVLATHPGDPRAPESTRKYVRFGASPRGVQALLLAAKVRALLDGRYNASCRDVREAAPPALRHRLIRNFEGEAEGITPDALIDGAVRSAAEPAEGASPA